MASRTRKGSETMECCLLRAYDSVDGSVTMDEGWERRCPQGRGRSSIETSLKGGRRWKLMATMMHWTKTYGAWAASTDPKKTAQSDYPQTIQAIRCICQCNAII